MEVLDEDSVGASNPKCGKPTLEEKLHRIGLRESVFNLSLVHKQDASFQDKPNSEFAEFLFKVLSESHTAMGKFKYFLYIPAVLLRIMLVR